MESQPKKPTGRPKKSEGPIRFIGCHAPPDMITKLDALAAGWNKTRSAAIREILQATLNEMATASR